jgi:hypothetical protein
MDVLAIIHMATILVATVIYKARALTSAVDSVWIDAQIMPLSNAPTSHVENEVIDLANAGSAKRQPTYVSVSVAFFTWLIEAI